MTTRDVHDAASCDDGDDDADDDCDESRRWRCRWRTEGKDEDPAADPYCVVERLKRRNKTCTYPSRRLLALSYWPTDGWGLRW